MSRDTVFMLRIMLSGFALLACLFGLLFQDQVFWVLTPAAMVVSLLAAIRSKGWRPGIGDSVLLAAWPAVLGGGLLASFGSLAFADHAAKIAAMAAVFVVAMFVVSRFDSTSKEEPELLT